MNNSTHDSQQDFAKQKLAKPSLIKRAFLPILALLVLLTMVAWLAGSFNDKVTPHRSAIEKVNLADFFKVKATKVKSYEGVAASLVAKQDTIISARILARINKIHVRAGDSVSQGQALITLEQQELLAKVSEAKQQVNAIKAKYLEAQLNYQRASELFAKKIVSAYDLDKSKADFDSMAAQLTGAKENLTQSETALSYATITSPIDGVVVDRFAQPGNTAQPGDKLLTLYNPLSLRVEGYVREALALNLSLGDNINVELDSLNKQVIGQVEEIVPAAHTGSRSFLIKVAIAFQDNLLSGMYARMKIPAAVESKLYVPQNYISQLGQLSFVYRYHQQSIQRQYVRLGKTNQAGDVAIISGVNLGDKLVLPSQLAKG